MPNDIVAFADAIYAALGGTAATPPAYYALAPQGTQPPYTVFQRMAASDEYTFDSATVSSRYMVKAISNRQWAGEAAAVYEDVHTALQGRHLNIAGFTALRCERSTGIQYQDKDRFWHVGGIYRVEAHAIAIMTLENGYAILLEDGSFLLLE
jgi:hypothetical protein